jgi:prepilin-type N-terminal cleavage/methylation domain-containing protein
MRNVQRAFTLIELLVVIAIIAILADILFPVFAQAKAAAMKTKDISNFKQIGIGTMLYNNDNDGAYPRSNSGGTYPCWGCGINDTVWGMPVMPYVKNEDVWVSPVDSTNQVASAIYAAHAPTMGVPVGSMTATQKLYARLVRTNMGMKYQFFSPWRRIVTPGQPTLYTSATVTESDVANTSGSILMASSIWDRKFGSGIPFGGGNWVIEAPCVQDSTGKYLKPVSQYASGSGDNTLHSYTFGWEPPTPTINSWSWLVYGGMWPFHNQKKASYNQPGLKDGTVIIGWADGSVRPMNVNATARGCKPFGTLAGKVTNMDEYLWDLE